MARLKLLGILLPFVFVLPLALAPAPAFAQNCEKNPNHKNCSNDVSSIPVRVNIDFDGQTTVTDGTAIVDCNNVQCDFNMTEITGGATSINLPASLRDLIGATEWRGTQLDPNACFMYSGGVGTAEILDITLRLFLSSSELHVNIAARAYDTEGRPDEDLKRDYGFNFVRLGSADTPAEAVVLDETFSGADLVRVDGKGPDRKFDRVPPCRCTSSNTPGCPDDVPVVPNQLPLVITIEDLS